MILIEKQPKYQPYHQENFINMNILLVKIYYRAVVVITAAQLHSTKPEPRFCAGSNVALGVSGDSRWWGSLTMVPTGNTAKHLSSLNHTTKTILHHHHHYINIIKMRYLLEPRDKIYVKGYGFMSFTRSMRNKYGKNLLIQLKNLLQMQ